MFVELFKYVVFLFCLQDGTEQRLTEGLSLIDAVMPDVVSNKLNHISKIKTEGDIPMEGKELTWKPMSSSRPWRKSKLQKNTMQFQSL